MIAFCKKNIGRLFLSTFTNFSFLFLSIEFFAFFISDDRHWQWVLHRREFGDGHRGHVARIFETKETPIYHLYLYPPFPSGNSDGHQRGSFCLPGTFYFVSDSSEARGWTADPMFVLIYNGRIFGDYIAKPNSLDDIPKPQNEQILVLASWRLFFLKNCLHIVSRFLGK